MLSADVDRSNDILSVTAYAPSPKDAEVIANVMVDAYMAYQTKPKATNTNDAIRELEEKRRDADMRLKTATESVAGPESKYGTIDQKDQRAALNKKQLESLNDSILRTQNEAVEAKTSLETAAKAMGIKPEDLLKQITNPDEADVEASLVGFSTGEQAQLRSELLQIQAQLHDLQQRYLPNHPYVAALKKRLHEKNLDYLLMLQRRWYAADRQREEFQKAFNDVQANALAMGQDSTEYKRLLDDVDRLKKERDGYLSRIREIELARDAGGLTIDVVSLAKADDNPAWPSFPYVGTVALLASFAVGMMLATVREKLDDRFRSATDMKSSLGLPVLAVIPQSTTKRQPVGQRPAHPAGPRIGCRRGLPLAPHRGAVRGAGRGDAHDRRHLPQFRRRQDHARQQPRDRDGPGGQEGLPGGLRFAQAHAARDLRDEEQHRACRCCWPAAARWKARCSAAASRAWRSCRAGRCRPTRPRSSTAGSSATCSSSSPRSTTTS